MDRIRLTLGLLACTLMLGCATAPPSESECKLLVGLPTEDIDTCLHAAREYERELYERQAKEDARVDQFCAQAAACVGAGGVVWTESRGVYSHRLGHCPGTRIKVISQWAMWECVKLGGFY